MTHWGRTIRAHTAQFWAEPQLSVDHQRAVDWIKRGEAWLEACPLSVRDAQPSHANNLGAMTDALSDLTDDVNGFYRKEQNL